MRLTQYLQTAGTLCVLAGIALNFISTGWFGWHAQAQSAIEIRWDAFCKWLVLAGLTILVTAYLRAAIQRQNQNVEFHKYSVKMATLQPYGRERAARN